MRQAVTSLRVILSLDGCVWGGIVAQGLAGSSVALGPVRVVQQNHGSSLSFVVFVLFCF